MSLIVCNSGPLIALGKIGQVDLLRELFGFVMVVPVVKQEVEHGGRSGEASDVFIRNPWIEIRPTRGAVDPLLSAVLDAGEAATITLANDVGASLVLIDETKARKIAANVFKLPVIGTGRVLVEAKRAGLIQAVKPWVETLRAKGYWLSDAIVRQLLVQASE